MSLVFYGVYNIYIYIYKYYARVLFMAHGVFTIVKRILMKYVRHDYMRCNYLYYCYNLYTTEALNFFLSGSADLYTFTHHILLCLCL